MRPLLYAKKAVADMTLRFPVEDGRIGLEVFPTALKDRLVPRRAALHGEFYIDVLPGNDPWPAFAVESLAQVKIAGAEHSVYRLTSAGLARTRVREYHWNSRSLGIMHPPSPYHP